MARGPVVGIVLSLILISAGRDAAPGSVREHFAAPRLNLIDFDGRPLTLAEYRGRPVVMNFWASLCPFCAAEMPDFERVHRALGDRVVFLGIDQCERCQGGTLAAAKVLARETGVTYRLAEDPTGSTFVAFGGTSMPTTIFIDGRGRVVQRIGGMLSETQLRGYIHRYLGVRDA